MSRSVDLDALRAEAQDEPVKVTVGGQVWSLLPAMPWDAVETWRAGNFRQALALCAVDVADGEAFAEAVMEDRPSATQLRQRLDAIYVQDTGESSAS